MLGLVCAALLSGPSAAQAPPPEPDEIVVTGERQPRTLLETSSSVAVVTEEAIEAQAAPDRLDQLLALIPNVQLGSGGEGPTIRGQDSTGLLRDAPAFFGGARPRATLQVDGRAVSFNEFVFGLAPVWDVAQVEVFRSPQTTTQGRNSIGGAIFVRTNDPTYEWEGRARAIAGNQDSWQGSLALSGPVIGDQLAFRVAGDIRTSRASSEIVDLAPGADPDRDEYGLLRLKLLAEPDALPGLRIETSYVHLESQAPQIEGIRPPFRERRDPIDGYGIFRTNVESITAELSYRLAPALDLTATLSHGDSLVRRFPPPGLGRTRIATRDWSAETILSWRPEGPVGLLGGIHRLRTELDQFIDLSAIVGLGTFDDRQDSLGLFGEATLTPLPKLTLTAGLRYQRDEQRRAGFLGPFELAFDRGFDAWLPKLSIAYEIVDGVRAGLLAQRAFNPGGTTLSFLTGEQDDFGAETLWNYEAFLRASLVGGRLTLAANLFYNDIGEAQRPQLRIVRLPDGSETFFTEFDNAPAAESYGLEVEADWRATPRLSLRAGLGLLETRVVETRSAADPLRGKEFQRSPAVTGFAALDWRPLDPLRLSAQARHSGGYFSDDLNLPELRIPAYTVVDARAAYEAGPLTLFGYARNLFDEFHLTLLFSPQLATAGDPREFGLGMEARF